MEACYEYWNCKQLNCVMYERKDTMGCWELEEVLCDHQHSQLIGTEQKYKCDDCNYYKSVVKNKIW